MRFGAALKSCCRSARVAACVTIIPEADLSASEHLVGCVWPRELNKSAHSSLCPLVGLNFLRTGC